MSRVPPLGSERFDGRDPGLSRLSALTPTSVPRGAEHDPLAVGYQYLPRSAEAAIPQRDGSTVLLDSAGHAMPARPPLTRSRRLQLHPMPPRVQVTVHPNPRDSWWQHANNLTGLTGPAYAVHCPACDEYVGGRDEWTNQPVRYRRGEALSYAQQHAEQCAKLARAWGTTLYADLEYLLLVLNLHRHPDFKALRDRWARWAR